LNSRKIKTLTVKGYRAYGKDEQSLNFDSAIAVVWGPNSQGKTSLGEALEFLLTGKTVRREMTASTADEFADALRNAHLDPSDPVYAEAVVIAPDGIEHRIRRTLTADYGKRQECASLLEINGKPAIEADLAALGIVLSPPPLQAPVLAQHTMSYLFSARPQDRATYFKTLLELTDLDQFRNDVGALENQIPVAEDPFIAKLTICSEVQELKSPLGNLRVRVVTPSKLKAAFENGARALIEGAGRPVPQGLTARLAEIGKILTDRRAKAFPVKAFKKQPAFDWRTLPDTIWSVLGTYIKERRKVTEESRRLIALFKECLKIPAAAELTSPQECPLCATPEALTPERVAFLRAHILKTEAFQTAESAAVEALRQISGAIRTTAGLPSTAMPEFLQWDRAARRSAGFTVTLIRTFLAETADPLVSPWLRAMRVLLRTERRLKHNTAQANALISAFTTDLTKLENVELVKAATETVESAHIAFAAAQKTYLATETALTAALNAVLDANANMGGWQEFIDLASDSGALLRNALIDDIAKTTLRKDLKKSLTAIDKAKEKVLEEKFSDLSGSVQSWWELLRPDEYTFFSALGPRPGASRTIDFKAGLTTTSERTTPKLRDVIAIFSQSQLHCLGLALFLARIEHEKTGFVLLDDPILSSDEDYRVHFNTGVLETLLAKSIQVIVLTQDQKTWKELENRYRHVDISMFQVSMENPAKGAIIRNTSNELLSMISRAEVLARGGHPDLSKQAGKTLRDAGERFCKEVLVKDRRAKGEPATSLADFDGRTLEWLCPKVDPLLTLDSAHSGKLQAFKDAVNPPSHDDISPSAAAMKVACGDLRKFVKDYLGW
jgi:hypothetical protein